MTAVWLSLAVACLLVGVVLLVLDRRKRRPAPPPTAEPGSLFMPTEDQQDA